MSKRILAFLCTLAILTGMIVVPATAVESTDYGTYQVGYSKKDLNPWVAYDVFNTPNDPSDDLGITAAKAAGSSYVIDIDIHEYDGERFTGNAATAKFVSVPSAGDSTNVTGMIDDNGDGYVGYGDGIFVTCTSVTDRKGNTVLYLCVDGLNVNEAHAEYSRNAICAELGQYGITKDRIMFTHTHAHASPSYGSMRTASDPALNDPAFKAYYDYTIEQIKNAAVEAFNNKSAASMSKGQISANASMAAMGYEDNDGNGWRLNFSRHYNVESILQSATVKTVNGEQWRSAWTEGTAIELIATPHSGRGFQQSAAGVYPRGHAKAGQYIYDLGEKVYKTNESTYYQHVSHVSEADDTLYVLQFTPSDGTKDPIVLINWRAHATMNGNGKFGLSSDFVNALRYRLENNRSQFGGESDYLVGFWQGAAGNITSTSDQNTALNVENGWKNVSLPYAPENPINDEAADSFYSSYYGRLSGYDDRFYYTAKYGYLLAMVSLDCLDSEMSPCAAGTIITEQVAFYADYQVYSDGLKAAAKSNDYIIDNGSPFAYTYTDEKTYVINSNLHRNQILEDRSGGTQIELNVIVLGPNVAMVTLPGEPFDRYSDEYIAAYDEAKTTEEAGGATVASQWSSLKNIALADNDWLDLIGGSYGMPFVLGYANSAYGYLAEAMSFDYNTFDETDPLYKIYGPGSYEANTAFLAKGTGEAIIAKLGSVLKEITAVDATIDGEPYSFGAAIAAFNGAAPIKLAQNIQAEVTISKDVVLDLNGYDINKITVKNGCTVQCMDSQTDDYTVEDLYGCGVIEEVVLEGTGKLKAVPSEEDGYLMLSEDAGNGGKKNYSFHRVDLTIDGMTLRTNDDGVYEPGVYYTGNFRGDEMVAEKVETFGIALSVYGNPTTENINTECKYSEFTGFEAGEEGNQGAGTLLRGIMKLDNPLLINNRYAKMKVYGSAYVKVDGEFVFGRCKDRSLMEEVEAADAIFTTYEENEQNHLVELYSKYRKIMQIWSVQNMKTAYENDEDRVLKILVVGNSHGQDATRMLDLIFETEAPEQRVIIGGLHYDGCTISQHAKFMMNGDAVYKYYKNGNYEGADPNGAWQEVPNVTADVGLTDENWDYVIMQQLGNYAGLESTYDQTVYMQVINYIENKVQSEHELLWHMTWASPDDPDLYADGAENNQKRLAEWYPSSPGSNVFEMDVMHQKIVENAQKYIEGDIAFLGKDCYDYVIPSATAIQYAHKELGYTQKELYRDFTHLSDYGRLMVGYLWYAKLMGLEQIGSVAVAEIPSNLHHKNSTVLEQNQEGNYIVTDDMRDDIKQAVNWTLAHPYTVEE